MMTVFKYKFETWMLQLASGLEFDTSRVLHLKGGYLTDSEWTKKEALVSKLFTIALSPLRTMKLLGRKHFWLLRNEGAFRLALRYCGGCGFRH